MEILLLTIVVGFVLTLVLGRFVLAELRRLKAGQEIRKEGPQWHAGKAGTPTMGGIMMLVSLVITTSIFGLESAEFTLPAMLVTFAFGAVGFLDDFLKVARKHNPNIITRFPCIFPQAP